MAVAEQEPHDARRDRSDQRHTGLDHKVVGDRARAVAFVDQPALMAPAPLQPRSRVLVESLVLDDALEGERVAIEGHDAANQQPAVEHHRAGDDRLAALARGS